MKRQYLFIFLALTLFSYSFTNAQCSFSDKEEELFNKYWEFKDLFESDFIRFDLDPKGHLQSDGIGTWDDTKKLYSLAGYGIPSYRFNYRENDNNLAHFVSENARLSEVLKYLSLEYDLLKQNGQNDEAEKSLNKIFLVLQAIRRLDMTANMYMHQYYTIYQNASSCNSTDLRFDGYSGFMLRDDVSWAFRQGETHNGYTINHTESAHQSFKYSISEYDQNTCGPGNPDFIACFPPWETDYESLGWPHRKHGGIASQDQLILIATGLAYVRKFIPQSAYVSVNGANYYPRTICANIAKGILNATNTCNRKVRYPACDQNDECDKTMVFGGNNKPYHYGLNHALSWIADIDESAKAKDWIMWQAGLAPIDFVNAGMGGNNIFNARMAIKTAVMADKSVTCDLMQAATKIGYYLAPYESMLLHNNDEIKKCSSYQTYIENVLCEGLSEAVDCGGPCYISHANSINGSGFPCTNTPSREVQFSKFQWSGAGPLYNNNIAENGKPNYFDPAEAPPTSFVTPVEYLAFYTVLAKSGILNHPFYNPNNALVSHDNIEDMVGRVFDPVICLNTPSNIQTNTSLFTAPAYLNWSSSPNIDLTSTQNTVAYFQVNQSQPNSFIVAAENPTAKRDCDMDYHITFPINLAHDYATATTSKFHNSSHHSCSRKINLTSNNDLSTEGLDIVSYNVVPMGYPVLDGGQTGTAIGEPYHVQQQDNNTLYFLFNYNLEGHTVFSGYRVEITYMSACGALAQKNAYIYTSDCLETGEIDDNHYRISVSPNPIQLSRNGVIQVKVDQKRLAQSTPKQTSGSIYLVNTFGKTSLLKHINNIDEAFEINIHQADFQKGENSLMFVPDGPMQEKATYQKLILIP